MSEQTLLPCPFCGTPPRRETFLETQSVDACRIHKIVCIQCGVASVTRTGHWFDDGVEDKEESQKVEDEAFAAWNRRAALSPAVAQPVVWIPTSARLPDKDGAYDVLACYEDGEMNIYSADRCRAYSKESPPLTHWMPLPPPPGSKGAPCAAYESLIERDAVIEQMDALPSPPIKQEE